MIVELHVIQNFAPSNLNRSDTGTPKDCEFGGHRRARVSSQCFKRAVRELFKKGNLFTAEQKKTLAERTRLVLTEIVKALVANGKDKAESERLVEVVLNAAELEVNEKAQTEYLLFLGLTEINSIAELCQDRWEQLLEVDKAYADTRRLQAEINTKDEQAKKGSKEEKQQAKDEGKKLKEKLKEAKDIAKKGIPKDLKDAVLNLLDGGKSADLSLFGRMIANLPDKNVDAACQVAHAISTHKVGTEFDFYTAVDDLLPKGATGAGMMGTLEYNSACFYRYANVDLKQLKENLKDAELEKATLDAFIRAFVEAVPSGKQTSYAAQQKPSFVMAVVREAGMLNLANAFVKPVYARENEDLVEKSIKELDREWAEMSAMYGKQGNHWFACGKIAKLDSLGERIKSEKKENSMIDELVAQVMTAIKPAEGGN